MESARTDGRFADDSGNSMWFRQQLLFLHDIALPPRHQRERRLYGWLRAQLSFINAK